MAQRQRTLNAMKHTFKRAGWGLAVLWGSAAAHADVTPASGAVPAWRTPVADSRLALTRAGFESPQGRLVLTVDVQRQVWVDAVPAADAALSGSLAPGATVIQNTLDRQHLQVLTTLNVTANSLQLFQGSALQSAVGSALAASTRR